MSDKDRVSQFLGGLKGLFSGAKEAPPAPQRQTGPLKNGPDAFMRQGRQTAPLAGQPTTPLPTPELSPEEKIAESKKRMAVIMTYMKDKNAVPEFKDPKFIYKIISDERTYQTAMVTELEAELRAFVMSWDGDREDPDFLARKEGMEQQIQGTRNRLTQLFMLLKHITGVKGKTGGTGFLPTDLGF
jgi:hypothetical protein